MSQSTLGRLWERLVGTTDSNTKSVGCACCGPVANEEDESKDTGGGCC